MIFVARREMGGVQSTWRDQVTSGARWTTDRTGAVSVRIPEPDRAGRGGSGPTAPGPFCATVALELYNIGELGRRWTRGHRRVSGGRLPLRRARRSPRAWAMGSRSKEDSRNREKDGASPGLARHLLPFRSRSGVLCCRGDLWRLCGFVCHLAGRYLSGGSRRTLALVSFFSFAALGVSVYLQFDIPSFVQCSNFVCRSLWLLGWFSTSGIARF